MKLQDVLATHLEAHPDASGPDRSLSRRALIQLGAATGAGVTLAGHAILNGTPATAAQAAVTVQFARPWRRPTYRATGFLHGLSKDGTEPPDRLLLPLKPGLFRGSGSTLPGGGWSRGGLDGYRVRFRQMVELFRRVSAPPYHAEYCIVMSDLWGANGEDIAHTDPYPGDGSDWSNYEAFVRALMADAKAAGMRPDQVQYELWNEPDYGTVYWPRPRSQYEEMWRRGYRLVKQLEPAARIVGPTFTRLSTTTCWTMGAFLDMAHESKTVPDILAWHDLIPGNDPVDQAATARRLLAERGIRGVDLEVNEYPAWNGLDPGHNAWYVARMERADIDYGVLAIFSKCCMYPELDGLLVRRNGDLVTSPRWWVYERYASQTTTLVRTIASELVDALACIDPGKGQARVLLGNSRGDSSNLGTQTVRLSGLKSIKSWIKIRGRYPLRIERLPEGDVLERPEVVVDTQLKITGDETVIDIPWASADDAYVITLGRQDEQLPAVLIVATQPSSIPLLRNEPAHVTVLLRNLSNSAARLSPAYAIPDGYTYSAPPEVTLPAHSDLQLDVTITRVVHEPTRGPFRVTIGTESAEVELEPTDNWMRLATMSASSSNNPSTPDNLNDGRTSSEDWGGGGYGGWNDATPSTFPDTVTGVLPHGVGLARIKVFTLDSEAYPAAAWGIRDYDVQVRTGGSFSTVAQVRDNTKGIVESTFSSVQTDAVRLVIHDTNDHAYSRLLELEAYEQ